ncbi:MAG: Holliday junction branch migration protein RuvA [Bacilli bacterium]|nr:Holliday junction branch migration protein RuvA [Bacilli bacterium]
MYYSFLGKIVNIDKESVAILVNSGIAYELLVARTSDYALNEETTIFVHEVFNENDHYLVGFKDKLEKDAFKSLIQVKGIGPKTAINALGATNPNDLMKAIEANNTSFLKKLPGIGPKAAAQIILDLKGRLADNGVKGNPDQYDEVREGLKSLGFKVKAIDDVLASISEPGLSNQEVLRLALKKLKK